VCGTKGPHKNSGNSMVIKSGFPGRQETRFCLFGQGGVMRV